MLIFLYGPDTYRSRRKLNEIIEHYKKIRQSGLNLKCFDGRNLNFQEFIDEIRQASIFKEKKLIILNNVFLDTQAFVKQKRSVKDERSSSPAEFKKAFLSEANKNIISSVVKSNDVILFYEEKEVPEKDALFIFLNRQGKCQEFKLLDSQNLKKWIEKEFFIYKSKINPKAVQTLIDFVGNNLWQMSNEIKKLASYKMDKNVDETSSHLHPARVIEVEDVELLVKSKIEADIFKTIDALAVKNKKQAILLIHKHLERGDNPLYLFSMINFQFRNLLIIKDLIEKGRPFYSLAKETRLHPYVVKKTYSQAQKFTIQELKKIYQKFFQIDLKIKTGQINASSALDLFIAEI